MVIAFVGTKGIPYQNTRDRNEYNLECIAIELVKKGHDIYVFGDPNYTQNTDYKGISIVPTKQTVRDIIKQLKKIKNLDIVHIRSLKFAWVAFWVSIYMPHIRIIFDYHDYSFTNTPTNRRAYRILSYISAQFSDGLIIHNPYLRHVFRNSYQSKLYMIPTGVEEISEIQSSHTFKNMYPQRYIVLNSSLYRDSKGLELWIKAYRRHTLNYPIIVLGQVMPQIRKQYQSSTILFVGELSGNTEKELIANAALFVELSRDQEDKYPLSLALTEGVPVLACRGIWNKKLIGNHGIFFSSLNYSSIITALNTVEDMSLLLSRRAAQYTPIIRDTLSLERQVDMYILTYLRTFQLKEKLSQQQNPTYSIPVIG